MEDWNPNNGPGNFEQVQPGGYGYGYTAPMPEQPQPKRVGFAVTSLVLGLVSLVGLCCCAGLIDIITVPLALIFGIISLVQKRGGTGLAITGVVTAAVSLLMIVTTLYSLRDILPYSEEILQDYMQVLEDQDEVFPAYEEDGTLPVYLVKYTESPYSDFLEKYDATIYTIMDVLLEQYKSGELANVNVSASSGDAASAFAYVTVIS